MATIFWPSISSYQVKDAYAHKNQFSHVSVIRIFYLKKSFCIKFCQVFWGLGRGQVAQARVTPGVSSPRGSSCPEAASPPGASCPGCKINRYTGIFIWATRDKGIVFLMSYKKKNPSLIFTDDMKMPTLGSTAPVGNSASLVSLLNGWAFPVPNEHQWWILF